ncbi:MAG: hypothetical protein JSS02_17275 [Planctomycetes bacterium]|nr:hypothetical protein [Planctomycetota bacterium]
MMNLKHGWLAGVLLLSGFAVGCGGDGGGGAKVSTEESQKKMEQDMQEMTGKIPQNAPAGAGGGAAPGP